LNFTYRKASIAYNHTGYSAFFVHFLIKNSRMIAGNNEAAANPKANDRGNSQEG
jgi:hypothetical protein